MPLTVGVSFPAGRFHATPWGHHVNEGLPEWPPSPWRLLRALVATWKRKLTGEPLVQTHLPTALAELATHKPEFHLPPATLGHTRHFMPLKFPDQGDRTKVFDAFVSLSPHSEIVVHWPDVSLSKESLEVLDLVLSQLGYLGRAESWSDARLLSEFNSAQINCRPGAAKAGQESVRVLTPDPNKWNAWDFKDKSIPKPEPLWNLLAETADMHQEKWSDPPGSKWVVYSRPSDCFAPAPKPHLSLYMTGRKVTVARFALDAPVLPLLQDTLPLAEAVHRCLVWLYCNKTPARAQSTHSHVLSGKDESGRPLDGHGHAYYLPTDEDGDGRIDHITVTASAGFGEGEVRALDLFRRLRWGESVEPLRLLLTGLGTADDFRAPFFSQAHSWISATPFLATRHLKKRGTKRDPQELWDSPADFVRAVAREELARWLQRRNDLAAIDLESVRIEPLLDQHDIFRIPVDRAAVRQLGTMSSRGHMAFDCGPRALRPMQFKRFRRKPGDDGGRRPAGAFRIMFPEPVRGPLCLGHSSHFGLGLFLPEVAAGQG